MVAEGGNGGLVRRAHHRATLTSALRRPLDEDASRILRWFNLLSLLLGILAAAASPFIPALTSRERRLFLLMLVGFLLPWLGVVRLLTRGPLTPARHYFALFGNLLVIFAFHVIIPQVSVAAMFAYLLVVCLHAYVGGWPAGMIAVITSLVLTVLAESVHRTGARLDAFTLVVFGGIGMTLTLLLERATSQLRLAVTRLRDLDESKNALLRAVSHDLRGPIAVVGGSAELLSEPELLSDGERRRLLDNVARNSRRLERMLDDLLDVDRMSRGDLQPNRTEADVAALARRLVRDLDLDSHHVDLQVEEVTASVDAGQTERILENLLVNATRHTPPGTRVILRVQRSGEAVLIAVDDDGPGVPDHLKRVIFEPFRQGENVEGGTGVGLSLVAQFARLHGGRAWVEDRDPRGASFRVLLPDGPVKR